MNDLGKQSKFFLGTNTSSGFLSKFSQLYSPTRYKHQYIIKAGAGCGKSTFMKKISTILQNKGYDVSEFPCSADPNSLDAVVCEELSFSICDGTAPHVIEPDFPGAVEQVLSFYHTQDNAALSKHKEDLILHTTTNKNFHRRCQIYLDALSSILKDNQSMVQPFLNHYKVERFCRNFIHKHFKSPTTKNAIEDLRFLSTITLNGITFFGETPFSLSPQVIEIKDNYGVTSHAILSIFRKESIKRGYHIITSYCPLSPDTKIEHLYIKDLGLYFITSNHFHSLTQKPHKTIHATRFLDPTGIKNCKQKQSFNKKLAFHLIDQIVSLQQLAKESHDKMEDIYIPAINFKEVDIIFDQLVHDLQV